MLVPRAASLEEVHESDRGYWATMLVRLSRRSGLLLTVATGGLCLD